MSRKHRIILIVGFLLLFGLLVVGANAKTGDPGYGKPAARHHWHHKHRRHVTHTQLHG